MRTITIVGIGYVGISNALVLAKKKVFAVDIDPEKMRLLNERRPPVRDSDIKRYLSTESCGKAQFDRDSRCGDRIQKFRFRSSRGADQL